MRKAAFAASLFSVFVLLCAPANADPQYIIFSVTDSTTTLPVGINNNGDVTGVWFDSKNRSHGFLRSSDGTITTFDAKTRYGTFPSAINSSGTIVGGLSDGFKSYAFIRSPDGQITIFKDPNGPTTTTASGINDAGWVSGWYQEPQGKYGNAFLLSPDGLVTETRRTNAFVTATALNNNNVLTGSYQSQKSIKGFVLVPGGAMKKFSVKGQSEQTLPRSINDAGTITGNLYAPNKDRSHGFVRTADGAIVVIDGPDATGTEAASINKDGTITGTYGRATISHGFIRTADGTFTSFDFPGSTNTSPTAINDNGVITGRVSTAGFIRIP